VLPAYRRAFLIQKSAGGGLSYKVKNASSPQWETGAAKTTMILLF